MCQPLPCNEVAETALQPLICCSESSPSHLSPSPEECLFHRRRHVLDQRWSHRHCSHDQQSAIVAPTAQFLRIGSQMQEVPSSNPRLGGLLVSQSHASGGTSTRRRRRRAVAYALCKLRPHIATCVFETYINGWTISSRMHSDPVGCLFGCPASPDQFRLTP